MNIGALGLCERSGLLIVNHMAKGDTQFFVNKQTVRFAVLTLVTDVHCFLGCDVM
jgi:hypothetical protein